MPPNQQIRTMQGDIEELQRKGMAAPPRPQGGEPPQGLPIEEKTALPAPQRPTLRTEIQTPAKPITPPLPPRPTMPEAQMPPRPVQPTPMPPKPPQEELSAKERLFITPKTTAPTPPAPPKKTEPEKPSFRPVVPPERTRWPKVLFTTVIIAALAGATGGFFYWWLVIKIPPLPPPPPPLEKPAALIPIDETKDYIITLTENDELIQTAGVAKRISTDINLVTIECNESLGTFKRILIKNTIPEEPALKKEEYLNLFQLLDIMKIPSGFLIGISDSTSNYTLFSYTESDGLTTPYVCDRIVLAMEINNIEEAKKQLAAWVPYIENELENNIKDILSIPDVTPATPNFQDNIYKNTKIRYKNYPDPDFSFDYAIYEPKNLLIFTTSRESMWTVIDKLTQ